jgi:hypothetical protein
MRRALLVLFAFLVAVLMSPPARACDCQNHGGTSADGVSTPGGECPHKKDGKKCEEGQGGCKCGDKCKCGEAGHTGDCPCKKDEAKADPKAGDAKAEPKKADPKPEPKKVEPKKADPKPADKK